MYYKIEKYFYLACLLCLLLQDLTFHYFTDFLFTFLQTTVVIHLCTKGYLLLVMYPLCTVMSPVTTAATDKIRPTSRRRPCVIQQAGQLYRTSRVKMLVSYVSTMYSDVASYDCGYGQNPSNYPTTSVCNTTGWSSVPYFTCQDVGK